MLELQMNGLYLFIWKNRLESYDVHERLLVFCSSPWEYYDGIGVAGMIDQRYQRRDTGTQRRQRRSCDGKRICRELEAMVRHCVTREK